MRRRIIALSISLVCALVFASAIFGAVELGKSLRSNPAPCHTAVAMEACVLDISGVNAGRIGVPINVVDVACKQVGPGWGCFVKFPYNGREVCFRSYIEEGKRRGVPVFYDNKNADVPSCKAAFNQVVEPKS